ncbi:hypothetical protein NM208_g12531 [Fusarium decemcellulare]|uniref:Uncharacterized protein n=1 Tax=Fusarium decemcellulare TaxID=57161 RepID=A0ACC1RNM8_9HYPO|nr:hypothetical protein NM208_g12531 [Fusarium decemcellulare]
MPHVLRTIHVLDVWPLAGNNDGTWTDGVLRNDRRQKPTGLPLQVTACFRSGKHSGLISSNIVELALGAHVCHSSQATAHVGISWAFSDTHQNPETSYLQVVSGLSHHLIIPNGSDEGPRALLPQPPPSAIAHYTNEAYPEETTLGVPANEKSIVGSSGRGCVKDNLADHDNVRALAASQGILLANPQSVEVFASLIHQLRMNARQGANISIASSSRPGISSPSSNFEEAQSWAQVSNSSLHGSGFDECDLECNWSIVSSEHPAFLGLQGLSCSHGPVQPTELACSDAHISTSQNIGSHGREQSPASNWLVVEDTIGNEGSATTCGEVVWDDEDAVPIKNQLSDFEMHPGHKTWVWDVQRQRWRRRGRSGLEETDWFPESLA